MLAHHEALLVLQAAGPLGLTGWAALIGARWYSLSRRSAIVSDRSHPNDKSNGSSDPHQGTS